MNCSVTFNSSSCFNLATSVTKTFFPFGGGGVCVYVGGVGQGIRADFSGI